MDIDEIFRFDNALSGIIDADYMNVWHTLERVETFARLSYQMVYVVDFCKKDILCAYGDFNHLCGMSCEDVMKLGLDLYVNHVPHEELVLLEKLNCMVSSFFETLPEADLTQYTIFCDFHFRNGNRCHLVNHQVTPLAIRNGKPWIVMCALSLPSNKSIGNLCVKKYGVRTIYKCPNGSLLWEKQDVPPLKDIERDIIVLSAQGKTMREIAKELGRSEDTIKACKRELFKKLETSNMVQTVQFVMNYKLM